MTDHEHIRSAIDLILVQKRLQALSWHELAKNLPISGDSLRIAFSRRKVKLSHLLATCEKLGIDNHNLANTENLEILNKNELASKYISVPLVNRLSYNSFYKNMDDIAFISRLPKISWYAENLNSTITSQFLSLEVEKNCMNDGSFQSIVKFDLLLLQQISPDEIISESFENSKMNFVIIHTSPKIGIQVCRVVLDANGKTCNYVSFLNQECSRFKLILKDIRQCYKVIRLVRNSIV